MESHAQEDDRPGVGGRTAVAVRHEPAGRMDGRGPPVHGGRTGGGASVLRPAPQALLEGPQPPACRLRGFGADSIYALPVDEHILVVEDDRSIRETLTLGLEAAAFRITSCADGREGLLRFRRDPFDLVLLDVMLPSLDGFDVCREIRKDSRVPIVMITARAETSAVVTGLELGADAYVTKPFEMPELVARLRAVLRRTSAEPDDPVLKVGDLEIDPAAFVVRKEGRDVAVTATEFRLLVELARNRGRVLSRTLLLQRVWDYEYLGDSRLVDVAVQRLRARIEDDPAHPK